MYRKNNFEKLFILVFVLSIVFTLNIAYAKPIDSTSYGSCSNTDFNVAFEQVKIVDGKGVDFNNSYAKIIGRDSLVINAKDLEYPGARIEYEATVKNIGSLPAKLDGIKTYGLNESDFIKVKTSTLENKIINPGEEINVIIIVYWDSKSDSQINIEKNFSIELNYVQAF